MTTAAALLTGCGAQLTTNLERIERQSDGPVYWLGRSFEGLPLTHADAWAARRELLVYGECRGLSEGFDSYRCTAPQVQVQHLPFASPSRYSRSSGCTRTMIRGVPAAWFGGLEVYTGRVLVTIHASSEAQARRAATALRSLDGSISASESLPPPASEVSEPLRRCALDSLEAKLRELRAYARIPLLWAGRRFQRLSLVRAEGVGRWARFLYSSCKKADCWPPLTLELSSVDGFRPAGWVIPCTRFRVRGALAALLPSAGEVVVFTGRTAVRLQGRNLVLPRRAADALRPLDAGAATGPLPAPSGEIRKELRDVCPP
jgi:hypothetical protein